MAPKGRVPGPFLRDGPDHIPCLRSVDALRTALSLTAGYDPGEMPGDVFHRYFASSTAELTAALTAVNGLGYPAAVHVIPAVRSGLLQITGIGSVGFVARDTTLYVEPNIWLRGSDSTSFLVNGQLVAGPHPIFLDSEVSGSGPYIRFGYVQDVQRPEWFEFESAPSYTAVLEATVTPHIGGDCHVTVYGGNASTIFVTAPVTPNCRFRHGCRVEFTIVQGAAGAQEFDITSFWGEETLRMLEAPPSAAAAVAGDMLRFSITYDAAQEFWVQATPFVGWGGGPAI